MKNKLKYLVVASSLACLSLQNALADTGVEPIMPKSLAHALINSLIFAFVGMAAVMVAVILFDKATPKISIQDELLKNNTAVAIVTAAVVIGVSIIVAASIM